MRWQVPEGNEKSVIIALAVRNRPWGHTMKATKLHRPTTPVGGSPSHTQLVVCPHSIEGIVMSKEGTMTTETFLK
jgi:hypothetical protein